MEPMTSPADCDALMARRTELMLAKEWGDELMCVYIHAMLLERKVLLHAPGEARTRLPLPGIAGGGNDA